MKIKSAYQYLSLAIVHALLIFIAFPSFVLHWKNALLCDWGDGIKNYFTLYSYTREPIGSDGIFKYNSFAYPFGDYVYYTDNTPFFAIPFRWFCQHVTDVSAYTLPVYNLFIIGNIILCSLLAYYIFRRLLGRNIFSYILAIILPWVNMQTARIWLGDFNLSYSSLILAAIVLFIAWYNYAGNLWKQTGIAICMILLSVAAFLFHGYYIAIVATFLAGMLFFLGIFQVRKTEGIKHVVAAVVIPVLALASVLLLVAATDKYLHLRQDNAMCYDCTVLKTNFSLLFTHYDFHTLAFPIASTKHVDPEMMVYLGNVGLFAFGVIWFGAVFSKSFRRRVFAIQKDFFADPLRRAIFWGGFMMLVISLGEHYISNRNELKLYTPVPWFNDLDSSLQLLCVGIAALVVYGTVLLINAKARENLKEIGRDYKQYPCRKAGQLLCIALMVYLFVARYTLTVVDVFNPYFYLHFITSRVEQFRCLSRFAWPFFWVFNIWMVYTVIQLYGQSGKRARGIILSLLIIAGGTEMTDYIVKMKHETHYSNVLASEQLKDFDKLKINSSQYQAILPIPYYIVGSEDYAHTIDDNAVWSLYTMRLSLYSRLPLMACKMSRTPPEYSIALLDMVCNDTLQPILKSKLSSKPILICLNRALINDPAEVNKWTTDRPQSKEYYNKAIGFVARHHLAPIDSMDDVLYYSWMPQ